MARLELWFDFSCPYAYLAVSQAPAIAARTGAELDLRPMLLGGVFRALDVPQKLFATLGEAKTRHNMNDMQRWARLFDTPLEMPAGHPVRTVDALRSVLAVGAPYLPLVQAFFQAYWVDHVDISTDEGLSQVLSAAGHDPAMVLAKARSPEIKAELRARTDEALDKGVFGAPAMFVGDEMFWGQDRLHLVEAALGGRPAPLAPDVAELKDPVDFYFDYSSPFAYIASKQADRFFGEHARWRPMLLGAVFKMVEQVNVPMFAMSDAKRRYYTQDIQRQSEEAQAELQWPSHFPLNSVLALRVTIKAKAHETPEGRQLVHRLFRAYWVQGQDISDPEVVAGLATEVGLDGPALVQAASEPANKEALKVATQRAVDAGVFGAPTFVVRPDSEAPSLFWGVDRIPLAARAAAGDDRVA